MPDSRRYDKSGTGLQTVKLARSEVSGVVHAYNGRGEAPRFYYGKCGRGMRGRAFDGTARDVTCVYCLRWLSHEGFCEPVNPPDSVEAS